MSSIDLSKLASILSDDQSSEDNSSVHNKIDRLITRKPSWTESMMAIIAMCTLFFGLFASGLTGYLNLREPLKAAIKDIQRIELSYKTITSSIRNMEVNINTLKNSLEHHEIRDEYTIEKINARLVIIEEFIKNTHK